MELEKSGITEFDELVSEYYSGKITFIGFTDGLWNQGYKAGKQEAATKDVVDWDEAKNRYFEDPNTGHRDLEEWLRLKYNLVNK